MQIVKVAYHPYNIISKTVNKTTILKIIIEKRTNKAIESTALTFPSFYHII